MVKGNHDKSVDWLLSCGAEKVLHKHGEKLEINDHEYPANIFCVTKNADPRIIPNEGVAVSHEPYLNIGWPYLYGHTHNNPIPWGYDDRPYILSEVGGRNVCVEQLNYMPTPLPFLIDDTKWINRNYKHWFMRLFGYVVRHRRRSPRE